MPIKLRRHPTSTPVVAPEPQQPVEVPVDVETTALAVVPPPEDAPLAKVTPKRAKRLTKDERTVKGFFAPKDVAAALRRLDITVDSRLETLKTIFDNAPEPKDQLAALDKIDEVISRSVDSIGIDLKRAATMDSPELWKHAAEKGLLRKLEAGDNEALRTAVASGKLEGTGLVPAAPVGTLGGTTLSGPVQVNNYHGNLPPAKQAMLRELEELMVLPSIDVECTPVITSVVSTEAPGDQNDYDASSTTSP